LAQIAERHKVSAPLVFYLVHSTQFGIGVLGFQKNVVKYAGHDSWISVILIGLIVHLYIWMIYQILKHSSGSLMTLQHDLFGKWVGNGLNIVWIIYFFLGSCAILIGYIEILKVWMFEDLNIWIYTAIFMGLLYYIFNGGFRVVTGFAFFGVVLPLWIFLTFLIFPTRFADLQHLLPIMDHSPQEIFMGTMQMVITVIGFETLFLYYPFVKNIDKSQKWAHIGNLFTTCSYIIIMIVSIVYYSAEEEILRNKWATLAMWKIVELPFVERFEYIGIASWSLVILPNICVMLWSAKRGITEIFGITEKKAIISVLVVMFFIVNVIVDKEDIQLLNRIINTYALGIVFCYIPVLYLITFVRDLWKRRT